MSGLLGFADGSWSRCLKLTFKSTQLQTKIDSAFKQCTV